MQIEIGKTYRVNYDDSYFFGKILEKAKIKFLGSDSDYVTSSSVFLAEIIREDEHPEEFRIKEKYAVVIPNVYRNGNEFIVSLVSTALFNIIGESLLISQTPIYDIDLSSLIKQKSFPVKPLDSIWNKEESTWVGNNKIWGEGLESGAT